MKESIQTAIGLSVPVVVFVVFLTLKLCKVITWSWWWITSPLWLMVAITLVAILISMVIIVLRVRKHNRRRIHLNK